MGKVIGNRAKEIMGKAALAIACSAVAFGMNAMTVSATETPSLGMSVPIDPASELVQKVETTQTEAPLPETNNEPEEEEEPAFKYVQNNEVKGTGRTIKTNLSGHYYASGVEGIAMTDQEWSLQVEAGMAVVEYFWVNTWDITQDTAPLAVSTFRIVADSQGAELGPVVQINIHKTFNGKMTSLEGNEVKFTTVIGIPSDFRVAGAKYAVVLVKAGGAFEILPDMDEDDNTVTFKAKAGDGAYAIIRY